MSLANNFAESQVTVKKDELLAAIQSNRTLHKEEYDKAMVGFRIAAIEAMTRHINQARDGGEIKLSISLVTPIEHTKDYDRVIRMLTMSTADEVTVSEAQFQQYVMDDWAWKQAFVGSTAGYNGPAKR